MSAASEILVIILAVFLALFLILGIILAAYLIKVTRQIKRITQTAENTVDGIEHVVSRISKLSSPLLVADMIRKYVTKVRKAKK
jgi:cell division protein FtsB